MGIRHLLLLLIYLEPLSVLCVATGGKKVKSNAIEAIPAAIPTAGPQNNTEVQPPSTEDHRDVPGLRTRYVPWLLHDLSGQYEKEFECINTSHPYCCEVYYYWYYCQFKGR